MQKLTSALVKATLLGLALSVSGCAGTPPGTSGRVVVADDDMYVDVRFSDRDRALIREYYRPRYRDLPPGLAKKGKVPPGHARKLARYDRLPRDAVYHHLPHDLEERLGRLPSGYMRVKVGQDVIILDHKVRVIFDVINDID